MKVDVTGKKELATLKFDWKIYQLNAASTKCCAGGTRDVTWGKRSKGSFLRPIPNTYDEKDAKTIASTYGYLRK